MVRLAVVALATLTAAACSKADSTAGKAGPGTGAGTGTGTAAIPAPPPTPAGAVAVFVDDKPTATLDAATIATWPRIDAALPAEMQKLGTWESISLRGTTNQDIMAPADRYPSLVPALYPGADGGVAFGMFDIVDHAKKAAPRVTVAGVREIRIKLVEDSDRGMNEDGGGAGFDVTKLSVAIEGGTKPRLTGEEIINLKREPPPNGDVNTQGWRLTTLLDAAGIKNPKELLLSDSGSVHLTVTAAQLDPATSVPYLKLNKQGALRFRIYTKEGSGWTLGGNLKGLASIKVVK
jgi:hypothetical protein